MRFTATYPAVRSASASSSTGTQLQHRPASPPPSPAPRPPPQHQHLSRRPSALAGARTATPPHGGVAAVPTSRPMRSLRSLLVPTADGPQLVGAAPVVAIRTLLAALLARTRGPTAGGSPLGLALAALVPAIETVEIYLFKLVVDDVLVPRDLAALVPLALAYLGLALATAIVSFADDYLAAWVGRALPAQPAHARLRARAGALQRTRWTAAGSATCSSGSRPTSRRSSRSCSPGSATGSPPCCASSSSAARCSCCPGSWRSSRSS